MHIVTLQHSEMPKALTILSAVINKIHLYLKKDLDEGQHTKCIYLPYNTQKCPKL